MSLSTEKFSRPQIEAFAAKLRELGYVEGRDFVIDKRWAEGSEERLPALARELISLGPAVIVASSPSPVAAFKQAGTTLPLVFIAITDPVLQGFVASLPRPGGNMTGTTFRGGAMNQKVVEMLREILPAARRVALLHQEDDPSFQRFRSAYGERFSTNGLEPEFIPIRQAEDIERAYARIAAAKASAIYAAPQPFLVSHARKVADLALKARLPLMGTRRAFTDEGGLFSYDNNLKEDFRGAAVFVDKILKGAKPADLPVEQPDRFELVINLRTAKTLGLKIPQAVLLRATEVIE